MSADEDLPVRIGNTRLTVPIYETKARTEALARELTEQLQTIEAASNRIDSTAFALRLAYDWAVRAAEAERLAAEETRDAARALERLLSGLRALAATVDDPGEDDNTPDQDPPPNLTPFRA